MEGEAILGRPREDTSLLAGGCRPPATGLAALHDLGHTSLQCFTL